MMKVPMMMTLVVILALLEENRGGVIDIWVIDADAWCSQNVPRSQPYRSEVMNYCKGIINDLMMPNKPKGCDDLYYLKQSSSSYPGDYSSYFNAANIIYDGMCAETTPAPERPIANPQECGKSDSLSSTTRRTWSGLGRIVGGTNVRDCSVIPWQVRLQVGRFLCGGSIISDRHILTASHCLEEVTALSQVEVTLADHKLDEWGTYQEKRAIKNMTMHENYNPTTYESDIAILTLRDPIPFDNPCVAKICRDPYFQFDGQYCTVSGWGTTSADGEGALILQMVHVKTHEGRNCDRQFGIKYPSYVYDKQQMLCAGHINGGKDSCQGDSGGPLVCLNSRTNSFVQVGVVSFGQGCAEANLPGVYANVLYFDDWIDKIMAENRW